jgi:hypothetical protein
MSARQALVNILQASGADSPETAREIASLAPAAGGSWIIAALDSGKIDEVRLAQELATWSRSPYLAVESARVERSVLELIRQSGKDCYIRHFQHGRTPLGGADPEGEAN